MKLDRRLIEVSGIGGCCYFPVPKIRVAYEYATGTNRLKEQFLGRGGLAFPCSVPIYMLLYMVRSRH